MKSTLPFIKILFLTCILALVACGGESTTTSTTTAAQCADSIDNDSDGLTDLADPGCANAADDNESDDPVATTQCADGSDNDSDGLVDLTDPGCANAADDNESDDPVAATQCADGSDNDGDNLVDLSDPGCANAADDDETDPVASSAHTAARANAYDDAWESAWIAKAKNIVANPPAGISKTVGKVLQVGDSMTFSFANGLWARSGAGRTADDLAAITWMFGDVPSGVGDPDEGNNGWNWSFTGVTAENNANWFHGLIDNIYTDTRLNDAQFAVVMFNAPFIAPVDMSIVQQRVDEFIAAGIVPILSTIPPRKPDPGFDFNVEIAIPYNAALHTLAEANSLPIIDFYEEILLRRPGDTWIFSLIGTEATATTSEDGVHPSGGINGYNPESDPYADGGDPQSHTTGNATLNSGYLLRTWLTVQKIKEIKQKVID